eukprot:753438-Hanusia_phi.AAC.2
MNPRLLASQVPHDAQQRRAVGMYKPSQFVKVRVGERCPPQLRLDEKLADPFAMHTAQHIFQREPCPCALTALEEKFELVLRKVKRELVEDRRHFPRVQARGHELIGDGEIRENRVTPLPSPFLLLSFSDDSLWFLRGLYRQPEQIEAHEAAELVVAARHFQYEPLHPCLRNA